MLGALMGCARASPTPLPSPPAAPVEPSEPPPVVAQSPEEEDDASIPPPPSPTDTLVGAYAKRLEFKQGGPVVPVGLMEGAAVATFVPRGRLRIKLRGPVEKVVEAPAGGSWQVRITQSQPAQLHHRLAVAELSFADKAGLAREL